MTPPFQSDRQISSAHRPGSQRADTAPPRAGRPLSAATALALSADRQTRLVTSQATLRAASDRRRTIPWWRLHFHLLRGLETLLRLLLLGRLRHAEGLVPSNEVSAADDACEDPWRRQLSVGHGCPGPDLATPTASAIDRGANPEAGERPIEVAVVGPGPLVTELVGRLVGLGAKVHATAETVEDYVALRTAGAIPHRFEDLPAVVGSVDLLISTSLTQFVGARIVARLPDTAVILDLAGPPGSVDFETSQRLGREVIWSNASRLQDRPTDPWAIIHQQIEAIAACKACGPA